MKSISFDSLPDDIIIQILLLGITDDLEYLEPEDPKLLRPDHSLAILLSISQTNRSLKRLTLSYPFLWSTIYIFIGHNGDRSNDEDPNTKSRDEGLFNLFQLWVERSDNVPLNYFIVVRERTRTTDDLLKLLFREKYRWQSIELPSPRGLRFLGPPFGVNRYAALTETIYLF